MITTKKIYELRIPDPVGSPTGSFFDAMRHKMTALGRGGELEACFQRVRDRRQREYALAAGPCSGDSTDGMIACACAVEVTALSALTAGMASIGGVR